LGFTHPGTGEWVDFSKEPPEAAPWDLF